MMNETTRITQSREESAVSPVVAVILMVAVTVVLAAIIGAFVFDLGQNVSNGEQSNLAVTMSQNAGTVTVQVLTGEADKLSLLIDSVEEDSVNDASPGDTLVANNVAEGSEATALAVNNGKRSVVSSESVTSGSTTASTGGESYDSELLSISESDADIIVDDDGGAGVDYTSFDNALTNATSGQTIYVRNGNYIASANSFANNLNITGESRSGVQVTTEHFQSGGVYGWEFSASDTHIQQMTFSTTQDHVIYFGYGSSGNVLTHVTLSGSGMHAIAVDDSSATVEYSEIDVSHTDFAINQYGTSTLNATNNYWGTTDSTTIDNGFANYGSSFDYDYEPYCSQPDCSDQK
jgi:flagellin-like protein